jgi:hypothetical protein
MDNKLIERESEWHKNRMERAKYQLMGGSRITSEQWFSEHSPLMTDAIFLEKEISKRAKKNYENSLLGKKLRYSEEEINILANKAKEFRKKAEEIKDTFPTGSSLWLIARREVIKELRG